MAANHVMGRGDTNCMFAVSGISEHQALAQRTSVGDLLSITRFADRLAMHTLDHGHIGYTPRYLENMLLDCVEGDPTGKLYARVEWKGSGGDNQTIGLRCRLLDGPSLPEILFSDRPAFCVWESKVRGVTFTDYSDRQENLKNAFAFTQNHRQYPNLAMRRQPDNAVDPNAIMMFCLVDNKWLEIGYADARDAKEIVQFGASGACFYVRLLKLDSALLDKQAEAIYHATYEVVGYAVSNYNNLPSGFEKLT